MNRAIGANLDSKQTNYDEYMKKADWLARKMHKGPPLKTKKHNECKETLLTKR